MEAFRRFARYVVKTFLAALSGKGLINVLMKMIFVI